jgi:hypothetical protein
MKPRRSKCIGTGRINNGSPGTQSRLKGEYIAGSQRDQRNDALIHGVEGQGTIQKFAGRGNGEKFNCRAFE